MHTRNGHSVRKSSVSFPASVGGGKSEYWVCTKCGMSHRNLGRWWDEENCVEYLEKQSELRHVSSMNPARLRKLQNLSFDEVFGDCHDPLEFLSRRADTVDVSHATTPKGWG